MLGIIAPLILGVVCICWSLFLWFRVRPNYEGWKKSPLFWDVAKFGAKNPEKAWKIYITITLIAMDIAVLVLIIVLIINRNTYFP